MHLLGWNSNATCRPTIAFEVSCENDAALVHARMGPLTLVGLIGGKSFHPESGVRINLEGKLKRHVGGALCPDAEEPARRRAPALHNTVGG